MKKSVIKSFTQQVMVVAVAALLLPVPTAVAKMRNNSDGFDTISLPADKAAKMAAVLERFISRAPRQDMAVCGDPAYPVTLSDEDLAAIRECVCLIKEEVGEVADCLEIIKRTIGDPCDPLHRDESIDFCCCTDEDTIDGSKASVISYLRTILRELRGIVGVEEYCQPCSAICSLIDGNIDDCDATFACTVPPLPESSTCSLIDQLDDCPC